MSEAKLSILGLYQWDNTIFDLLQLPAYENNSFGPDDKDIIDAVRTHTTGALGMTKLQKIIYLADATEPMRHFYYVDELRRVSEEDLDEAMLLSLESTVNNLKKRDLPIDENTNLAYNEIKELVGRK